MDQAKHAWAILALLVKALRKEWPDVKIVFRADGGFCRDKMLTWCERQDVDYVVGIAQNNVLTRLSKIQIDQAQSEYEITEQKQRFFSRFAYKAGAWKKERTLVVKAEHTDWGLSLIHI